jgi:hypothetical protein
MNRFFKTNVENYEAIRAKMDRKAGYPSSEAETWFAPMTQAPKDLDGNILIAAMPEISEEFILAGAIEISEEQYNNLIIK